MDVLIQLFNAYVSYFHPIIVHLSVFYAHMAHICHIWVGCVGVIHFFIDTLSEDFSLPKNMLKYFPPKKTSFMQ